MLLWATFDQNSVIARVKILDSTAATGAGKTGLTSASTGLIISTIADSEAAATAYTVAGSTIETITTLGTYAAPTATKCRFKEVDATNHPGIYELQFADARFSIASSKSLLISISGVSGAAQCDAVIPLPVIDLFATGVQAASLATQAKADVNAEVDAAIADARLDEILAADSDIDGVAPPAVGSVVHEMLSKTAGSFTFDQTTDSLEAIRDKAADIETDTAVIGALGAGLTGIPWNAAWDAEVESEATDALNAYDAPTKAEQDAAFTEIKGATWAAGTDTLELIRDKETDIDNKTTNLPPDPADESLIIAATDAIMTRLGLPAGASVSADIATRLASADITLTGGKVTPIDVDGLTHAKAMEVIMAALLNVAVPSGSTVAFKRRDGTTLSLTITYGAADGERTGSVIA